MSIVPEVPLIFISSQWAKAMKRACTFVSIPVSFFIFLERPKAVSLYQILHFQPNTVEFPVASPLLYL